MEATRNALEILPEDTWQLVLDLLIQGTDLIHAYSVCTTWNKLLKKHQFSWIFCKCVPILVQFLPLKDILCTRLVCKMWKLSVDKYLQSDHLNLNYSTLLSHETQFFPLIEVSIPTAQSRMKKTAFEVLAIFKQQFKNRQINPFVSRSLKIAVDSLNTEIPKFLRLFGKHVWYFTLSVRQDDFNPFDKTSLSNLVGLVKFLWRVLKWLPNVKMLRLIVCLNLELYPLIHDPLMNSFHAYLNKNDPPVLEKLVNLEIYTDVEISALQNRLVRFYGPQLNFLTNLSKFQMQTDIAFQNIKQLAWKLVGEFGKEYSFDFLKAGNFPKLTHLYLQITDEYNQNLCPTLMLKAVENHKCTLTSLSLSWHVVKFELPENMDLPMLKILNLWFVYTHLHQDWSFDFVKTLTNLQKLTLHFSRYAYDKLTDSQAEYQSINLSNCKNLSSPQSLVGHKIDILSCLDKVDNFLDSEIKNENTNIANSNVWTHVPSLRAVVIAIVKRTMSGFMPDTKPRSHKVFRNYYRKN